MNAAYADVERLLDQSRRQHDPDRWYMLVASGLDEGLDLAAATALADRIAGTPGLHGSARYQASGIGSNGVELDREKNRSRAVLPAGTTGPVQQGDRSVSDPIKHIAEAPERYAPESWPHPTLLHVERHGQFAHGNPSIHPPEYAHGSDDHWAIAGALGNAIKGRPVGVGFQHHVSHLSPRTETMRLPGDARAQRYVTHERRIFLADHDGRVTAGHYTEPLGVAVGRAPRSGPRVPHYSAQQLPPEGVRRYLDAQIPGLGGYFADWPRNANGTDGKTWEEMTSAERGTLEGHLHRMAEMHHNAVGAGNLYATVHAPPRLQAFLQDAAGHGDERLGPLIDHMQELGHPDAAQWAEMLRESQFRGYPLLHTNMLGQMMKTPFESHRLRTAYQAANGTDTPERQSRDPLDWTKAGQPERYEGRLEGPLVGVQHHGNWAVGPNADDVAHHPMPREHLHRLAATAGVSAIVRNRPDVAFGSSAVPKGLPLNTAHTVAMASLPDGRVLGSRRRVLNSQMSFAGDHVEQLMPGPHSVPLFYPDTYGHESVEKAARIIGPVLKAHHDDGLGHFATVNVHPDPHFRAMLRHAVLGGADPERGIAATEESSKTAAGILADYIAEHHPRGEELAARIRSNGVVHHHGPAVAGAIAEEIPVHQDLDPAEETAMRAYYEMLEGDDQ